MAKTVEQRYSRMNPNKLLRKYDNVSRGWNRELNSHSKRDDKISLQLSLIEDELYERGIFTLTDIAPEVAAEQEREELLWEAEETLRETADRIAQSKNPTEELKQGFVFAYFEATALDIGRRMTYRYDERLME